MPAFILNPGGNEPPTIEYAMAPAPNGSYVTRVADTLDALASPATVVVPIVPAAALAAVSCGPTPGLKPPVPFAN